MAGCIKKKLQSGSDIRELYQPLLKQSFEGVYNGLFKRKDMIQEWDTIKVNPEDNPDFAKLLKAVQDEGFGQIWKGITGEEENQPNYNLYVQVSGPPQDLHLAVMQRYEFEILTVKDFRVTRSKDYPLGFGASMTVCVKAEVKSECKFEFDSD